MTEVTGREPRRWRGLAAFGVIALLAATLFVRLGIWQLHRLDQRRARNTLVLARRTGAPADVDEIRGVDTTQSHWRRIRLRGVALYGSQLVHSARTQSGVPGVHLLTPVQPLSPVWGDTVVVLIRGFVAAMDGATIDAARAREGDTLDVETLVLAYPAGGTGSVRLSSVPNAVRRVDRDSMEVMIGHPLAPFMLLALGDTITHDVALAARVPPPAISEGPHWSYALQWFGFATVAIVGFVAYAVSTRRGEHDVVSGGIEPAPPRPV